MIGLQGEDVHLDQLSSTRARYRLRKRPSPYLHSVRNAVIAPVGSLTRRLDKQSIQHISPS